jgi:hypothetical protein
LQNDVVSALVSTTFLPCASGPSTYTIYRNEPTIDGSYANGFPQLW